ncbi:hypothetical protein QA644_24420 (plasmid) [Rhizobium sp. CC1099]|uniref:hypothetical protein n=1 Tax=Rhizobium sp. CC1099 TaxID=3039160 RepID=UPI0024B075F9|nr:hypothetical protein [Rhizobium sp. CC1099]WFU91325.1 hypothetical protein QA644_24420 [Rhizobium sp. CC1099]
MDDLREAEDRVGIGVVKSVYENDDLTPGVSIPVVPVQGLAFGLDFGDLRDRKLLFRIRRHA